MDLFGDVTEWKASPRKLRWTKEKPKHSGYYWSRYLARENGITVVFVHIEADNDYFEVAGVEDRWPLEDDNLEWAGPIPEPEE